MRILHVLAQMPAKTGSGVYYCNVIRRLGELGHTQAALYAWQGCDCFDLLPKEQRYPVQFQSIALPFPIPGMSDAMPYESTVYAKMDEGQIEAWLKAFGQELNEAKEKFQPDVVLLHHLWMLTSLGAQVFADAVTVGVCHNTDLRQALHNPGLKARYVTHIDRLDAVFSLSETQSQTIAQMYGCDAAKIIPLGGGFDEEIFYPPAEKPPFGGTVHMVYAAKIAAAKGIYALLDAYRMALREDPDLRLDIVGTPNAENFPLLADAVRGLPGVTLYDAMPQRQLAEHLRSRDIFIMPSFYEGIALMALESLACGLRTVVTEIEALKTQLGTDVNQSGVIEYVPLPRLVGVDVPHPEDLPAFTKALSRALLLQAGRVRQGLPFPPAATAGICRHSWYCLAQRMEDAMQALLRGQSLPKI